MTTIRGSTPHGTTLKVGDYAFWEYDGYPGILGGEITSIKGVTVQTAQYGGGRWFNPVFTLSKVDGRILMEQIKSLEGAKRRFDAEHELQLVALRKLRIGTLIPDVLLREPRRPLL